MRFILATTEYQVPSTFEKWYDQIILKNNGFYFPVHSTSKITDVRKVVAGVDAYPGVMPNCYIQSRNGIIVGDYTQIAANVALISANHDVYDTRQHITSKPIVIGKYCWIGHGAVILPGVNLGDFAIVGAGTVVTKSFPDYSVIVGNPAKVIKTLDRQKCHRYEYSNAFVGFISSVDFVSYRRNHLLV